MEKPSLTLVKPGSTPEDFRETLIAMYQSITGEEISKEELKEIDERTERLRQKMKNAGRSEANGKRTNA